MKALGGDPAKINPISPVDLVVDHSVQVDFFRRCPWSVCVVSCYDILYVYVCVCMCLCVCCVCAVLSQCVCAYVYTYVYVVTVCMGKVWPLCQHWSSSLAPPPSSTDALEKNQELEFERNKERFLFLKWGAQALQNFLIVPPGSGIVHQVRNHGNSIDQA